MERSRKSLEAELIVLGLWIGTMEKRIERALVRKSNFFTRTLERILRERKARYLEIESMLKEMYYDKETQNDIDDRM